MFAEVWIDHGFARKTKGLIYQIPSHLQVKPGDGVRVPFMKSEKHGVVLKVHREKPDFEVKAIRALWEEAGLWDWQLNLADWISEYYFCSKFDALRLMIPKKIPKNWVENLKKISEKLKKHSEKIHEESYEKKLTVEQKVTLNAISKDEPRISLIQGVTGSGKTEIYKQLIKKIIQLEQQAVFLVPEIALTPQFLSYLQKSFPSMAVLHSKVSTSKKMEIWKGVRSGEILLVLGSRSALFSPFKNLGLIIVDEEHEWSYKQDQSPRYHARDVAIKMAELTGAQVILGSATPSFESRYQAEKKNYKHYRLLERVNGVSLPHVEIIDMREELKKGNFSMFSDSLEQKISSALAHKEQVLLFLNRRGSGSSTLCRDCGQMSECPLCRLPLTYHVRTFKNPALICHHCGRVEAIPSRCKNCQGVRIRHLGTGTEKVETELQKLFPKARLARADKDTMGKRDSFSKLHTQLKENEIDILIGTQMIGKGWDLPKVTLVGVVLADLGLHIPDFRTSERIFQLLTQVAGRAGRRKKIGEVIVQTYNPHHPAIFYTQKHDYEHFYEQEMSSRKEARLPPFSKLVKIMILGETHKEAEIKAKSLAKKIETHIETYDEVPGTHEHFTAPAFLPQIRGKSQWNILIQGENPRELLRKIPGELLTDCRIDVDPLVSI